MNRQQAKVTYHHGRIDFVSSSRDNSCLDGKPIPTMLLLEKVRNHISLPHVYFIQVARNPSGFYPRHWYFQTPSLPLSDSYTLGYQWEHSTQFCMLYAFYIVLKIGKQENKLLSLRDGNRFSVQDSNTKIVLQFFSQVLREKPKLGKEIVEEGNKLLEDSYTVSDLRRMICSGISNPAYYRPTF